jgi:hypothetical protein
MNIDELITQMRATSGCQVFPPQGLPIPQPEYRLPDDLRRFYTLCGGLSLFEKADYALVIVPPARFVLANPVIVGELAGDNDISSSWYIVAEGGNGDYLTIDLSRERLGRCYDSFFDRHAVAGSCPIIARSFTELVTRLYENRGGYWYWLRPDFISLGDAYDDVDKKD